MNFLIVPLIYYRERGWLGLSDGDPVLDHERASAHSFEWHRQPESQRYLITLTHHHLRHHPVGRETGPKGFSKESWKGYGGRKSRPRGCESSEESPKRVVGCRDGGRYVEGVLGFLVS